MRLDEHASEFLGTPFKLKARGRDLFDCYGLLIHCLAKAGLVASPEDADIEVVRHLFSPIPVAAVRPGDVVILKRPELGSDSTHVAIRTTGSRYWSAERTVGVAQVKPDPKYIQSAYRLREATS